MALGRSASIALVGLTGHHINVEAHVSSALPSFSIIGLPDASLSEARDRVRAAIHSSGFDFPLRKITVNLAPASLPKTGSGYDLAIAVSVLSATGLIDAERVRGKAFIGELGLDGRVHPVLGILPAVVAARTAGLKKVYVPMGNLSEAELIEGIELIGLDHLVDAAALLGADVERPLHLETGALAESQPTLESHCEPLDLSDVVGQELAKFGLEIAAAGGHNLFMVGPPGTGKTMLAMRLPALLPSLTIEEALEVASIHSIAGDFDPSRGLSTIPPFESPHHTATAAAIVGGGSGAIRPGAVSRAHRGVLFLDEAPEFSTRVLQTLRQPMEGGEVVIQRAALTAVYPARFQLVAAANPCPCGNAYGQGNRCVCTSLQQRRYLNKLSGPLMDRVDLQFEVLPQIQQIEPGQVGESTASVRRRVTSARAAARERMKGKPWASNAQASGTWLRTSLGQRSSAMREIGRLLEMGVLSMRGADRVLRVAWTLADLAGQESPGMELVSQAFTMRTRAGSLT